MQKNFNEIYGKESNYEKASSYITYTSVSILYDTAFNDLGSYQFLAHEGGGGELVETGGSSNITYNISEAANFYIRAF